MNDRPDIGAPDAEEATPLPSTDSMRTDMVMHSHGGTDEFWNAIDAMITTRAIVIDRPKGSAHPRYPDLIYPLDYGYVQGTRGGDGAAVDVWRGSDPHAGVDAILCTVDMLKRDMEVKLLVGCSDDEKQRIAAFLTASRYMAAMLVFRENRRRTLQDQNVCPSP